ncbi:uncharacterized protein LOC124892981 [Capsicum annuum]|uniref:uncharacterized protein LOC124892981 n=1 Tax=Capsicum annuum TaxID=4072 RepID=UPI001FB11D2E|nr:uncharacterized protein LOC124892981 [Capsicum annuum]XP_047260102.1 uncharacterized protein LOC124892981 [Capsicum annuum]
MNDSSAREMNDRQPQKPCGCVRIFFQLFDRNRRFAKKLFPKKLLSPACFKQASKKFGEDEKQPKLRLIANENSGGFPNAKNNGMTDTHRESKREMNAPSASMPTGSGSKPQKVSVSETWSNVADKLGARPGGFDKEDMDFEMAEIKSSEPGLQRFRAKCALTYPTRYFSPLEDGADLVGNSLDHHSTDSYLSSSPNSSSKDKVLAESVDSVDDEPLFPEPNRDLSYCEISLSTRRSCRELIHNVSGVLSKIDQLKGSKLSYVKQVILNAKLIFGTTPQ